MKRMNNLNSDSEKIVVAKVVSECQSWVLYYEHIVNIFSIIF